MFWVSFQYLCDNADQSFHNLKSETHLPFLPPPPSVTCGPIFSSCAEIHASERYYTSNCFYTIPIRGALLRSYMQGNRHPFVLQGRSTRSSLCQPTPNAVKLLSPLIPLRLYTTTSRKPKHHVSLRMFHFPLDTLQWRTPNWPRSAIITAISLTVLSLRTSNTDTSTPQLL